VAWQLQDTKSLFLTPSGPSLFDPRESSSAKDVPPRSLSNGYTQFTASENEAPGVLGQNDAVGAAEFLAGFGTGTADDPQVVINGQLAPNAAPTILAPFAEDDGSISLASPTGLTAGNSVRINGAQIGDGPHGNTTGDFDFYSVTGVVAGQVITAAIDTPFSGGVDSVIGIWSSTGTLLDYNDDFNGLDSYLSFTAPTDGDYFISVQGYDSPPRHCCKALFPTRSIPVPEWESVAGEATT
jgi:hypothetical protein